jgi:hypothetical protein
MSSMLTLKNNEENESSEMSGPLYLLIQLRRLEVEVQGLERGAGAVDSL